VAILLGLCAWLGKPLDGVFLAAPLLVAFERRSGQPAPARRPAPGAQGVSRG
jgi:hypothetical protein